MDIRLRTTGIAFLCSLLIHGALLAVFAWYWKLDWAESEALASSFELTLQTSAQAGGVQRAADATQADTPPGFVEEGGLAESMMEEALGAARSASVTPNAAVLPEDRIITTASSSWQLPGPRMPRFERPPPSRPMPPQEQAVIAARVREWSAKLSDALQTGENLGWRQGGRDFQVEVVARPAADATELDRARLRITTRAAGETLQTELSFKRLAFSSFAQLVNRWDPDVAISRDRIDGRFHVNSDINIDTARGAMPEFTGKVTVADRINMRWNSRRDEIFRGGLETRTEAIRLPRRALPDSLVESAGARQLQRFDRDSEIVFFGNGEFSWRQEGKAAQRSAIGSSTLYLIAEEGVRLSVKGVVRGQVVVYAPQRITIADDLRYARNPRLQPDSPDFLALLSDGYVQVARPAVTGPGDLQIEAAIYAGRRFSIRSFHRRHQGTLRVYGSITAGSLSATEPRYATDLQFDPRLEAKRPPHFPMTERYEVEDWRPEWRVLATQ